MKPYPFTMLSRAENSHLRRDLVAALELIEASEDDDLICGYAEDADDWSINKSRFDRENIYVGLTSF